MKRVLLFLLVFLLSLAVVNAVEVTYTQIQDQALQGQPVSYKIQVNNNERSQLDVSIRSPDLNWILKETITNVRVDSGETKDFTVTFDPLSEERINPGRYGIKVLVITKLTTLEKTLIATVADYNDLLKAEFESGAKIDPRKGAILRLKITNKYRIPLNDLNLELASKHFQFTRTLNLGSAESLILDLPVDLKPETVRGDYDANVMVNMNDRNILDSRVSYSIQEYEDLKEIITPNTKFLIGGEKVSLKNDGNTPTTQTVTRKFGWFSYKFSSFDPLPTRSEKVNGKNIVQWEETVAPGTTTSVAYSINYRIPTAILFILVFGVLGLIYFRQKNALVVSKRVISMSTETGSVKVMKVILSVRNRGGMTVHNAKLMDKVPAEIKAPTQHGNLRPSHVSASPNGTVMIWEIPSIRHGQEIVVSYRLEGKINVMGKMMLPPAKAKYTLFGRPVVASSFSSQLKEKKPF